MVLVSNVSNGVGLTGPDRGFVKVCIDRESSDGAGPSLAGRRVQMGLRSRSLPNRTAPFQRLLSGAQDRTYEPSLTLQSGMTAVSTDTASGSKRSPDWSGGLAAFDEVASAHLCFV